MSTPPTQPPTAPDPWDRDVVGTPNPWPREAPSAPDPWPDDFAATPPPNHVPPEPAHPTTSRRAIALGAVVGLAVGAAAVGATWWASAPKATPEAKPKVGTFTITVDALPSSVLGADRVDLRVSKNGQNPAAAKPYVDAATSGIKPFEKAYGGPGIQMSYGATDAMRVTLTVANAVLPAPQELTNERIQLAKSITASIDPATVAYDKDNVFCVAAPKDTIKPESTVDPQALREQVLASTDGTARCIRTDATTKMSLMISARSWGQPQTMQQLAETTAEEINALWKQLA